MATTTIGSNPGTNDWIWDGSTPMHQCWIQSYSVSGLGRMIRVDALLAAENNGSGAGGAVAWQNFNWIGFYQNTGAPQGNNSTGAGPAWHNSTGDVPTPSTDSWQFGFYVASGVFCVYHDDGGTTLLNSSSGGAATGGTNVSAYSGRTGSMSAYGTYFIVETYIRRSGAWSKAFIYVRRSGAWSLPDIYIRRGGGWTQVGELVRRKELDWKREIEALVVWPDGSWEPAMMRWDYDRPRYIGVGHPEDPDFEMRDGIWQRKRRIIRPRLYEIAA